MDKFLDYQVPSNRVPVEAFWDQSDPRFLAIETQFAVLDGEGGANEENKMFGDLLVQDMMASGDEDASKKAA